MGWSIFFEFLCQSRNYGKGRGASRPCWNTGIADILLYRLLLKFYFDFAAAVGFRDFHLLFAEFVVKILKIRERQVLP